MTRSLEEIAEDPSLEERVAYPLYWVDGDDSPPSDREDELAAALGDADVAVIGDTDADGLGATGILAAKYAEDEVVYVPAGHRGGAIEVVRALELVADYAPSDAVVFVVDISPGDDSRDEFAAALTSLAADRDVRVRDHHEWPADLIRDLVDEGVDVEIVDGKCSAEIVQETDWPDAPEKYRELARITALHDLWKEDEWGEETRHRDLSNYAFWSDSHREYIETVAEYGADIRDDPGVDALLSENEREKQRKIDYVVDHSEWVDIGGYDVAFAYGTAYPSGVGSQLIAASADIAVIIKPKGDVSIRCSEAAPFATRIAQVYDGGGHPSGKTAGCDPGMVVGKNEAIGNAAKISYREHWESRGAYVATLIESTIERIVREIKNDPEADPADPATIH